MIDRFNKRVSTWIHQHDTILPVYSACGVTILLLIEFFK